MWADARGGAPAGARPRRTTHLGWRVLPREPGVAGRGRTRPFSARHSLLAPSSSSRDGRRHGPVDCSPERDARERTPIAPPPRRSSTRRVPESSPSLVQGEPAPPAILGSAARAASYSMSAGDGFFSAQARARKWAPDSERAVYPGLLHPVAHDMWPTTCGPSHGLPLGVRTSVHAPLGPKTASAAKSPFGLSRPCVVFALPVSRERRLRRSRPGAPGRGPRRSAPDVRTGPIEGEGRPPWRRASVRPGHLRGGRPPGPGPPSPRSGLAASLPGPTPSDSGAGGGTRRPASGAGEPSE